MRYTRLALLSAVFVVAVQTIAAGQGASEAPATQPGCKGIPYMGRYCGVNCIRAICRLHDLPMSWDLAALLGSPDRDGASSFAQLMRAFERLGLCAVPVKCGFDDLRGLGAPAILHMNEDSRIGHFVVCVNSDATGATIMELPLPDRHERRTEVEKIWSGKALVVYRSRQAVPPKLRQALPDYDEVGVTVLPTAESNGKELQIGPLWFDRAVKHLGSVERYGRIEESFTLENRSDDVVEIVGVKPSCHCIARTSVPDFVVPGQEERLSFVIDVGDDVGHVARTLTVSVKQGDSIVSGDVEIRYEVRRDILAVPSRIDFGAHTAAAFPPTILTITNPWRGTGVIHHVERSLPWISAGEPEYLDQYRIETRTQFVVGRPESLGPFSGEIRVFFEGAENTPMIIPVFGEALPDIQIVPRCVVFGLVGPKRQFTRRVQISAADGSTALNEMAILGTDSAAVVARVVSSEAPGSFAVELRLDTTLADDGPKRGNVTVGFAESALAAKIPYEFMVVSE